MRRLVQLRPAGALDIEGLLQLFFGDDVVLSEKVAKKPPLFRFFFHGLLFQTVSCTHGESA